MCTGEGFAIVVAAAAMQVEEAGGEGEGIVLKEEKEEEEEDSIEEVQQLPSWPIQFSAEIATLHECDTLSWLLFVDSKRGQ